ncbi:MAG: energy transducer TonB [Phycisphaeraceae bacterium]
MISREAVTARRRVMQVVASVAAAVLVNAAILWSLAHLNWPPHIERDRSANVRVAMLPEREIQPRLQPQSEAQPEAEPERMEHEFEAPTPEPMTTRELSVSVETPRVPMSPVRVAVATQAAPTTSESQQSEAQPVAPAGPMAEDEVDQPPRPLAMPRPGYPRAAERRRVSGSVTLRILINDNGRVEQSEIVDVTGHAAFEQAVLDVVNRWRFRPAQHDGRTVRTWGELTINFQPER